MNIIHVFLLVAFVLALTAALVQDLTKWSTTSQVLAAFSFLSLIVAIIYAFTQ